MLFLKREIALLSQYSKLFRKEFSSQWQFQRGFKNMGHGKEKIPLVTHLWSGFLIFNMTASLLVPWQRIHDHFWPNLDIDPITKEILPVEKPMQATVVDTRYLESRLAKEKEEYKQELIAERERHRAENLKQLKIEEESEMAAK